MRDAPPLRTLHRVHDRYRMTQQNAASPPGLGDLRNLAIAALPLTIVTILIAVGISLAFTLDAPKKYDATAQLSFTDTSTDVSLSGVAVAPTQTAAQLGSAGAEQVQRAGVAQSVARAYGDDLPGTDPQASLAARQAQFATRVRDALTVSVDPNSNLVLVEVRWSDGLNAARLANLVAVQTARIVTDQTRRRYAAQARELSTRADALAPGKAGSLQSATKRQYQTQVARLVTLSTLANPAQVATRARPVATPSSPRPVFSAVIAGVLGAFLGIAITILRTLLDRRVRDTSDLEALLDRPIVGEFPKPVLGLDAPLVHVHGKQAGLLVDRARILRKNLDFVNVDVTPRVILVTSSTEGEGKSSVAAALAVACALGGEQVLLVDADLRRPVVADRFRVDETPGLSEYLTGESGPQEVLRVPEPTGGEHAPGALDGLVVLPAGGRVPQPADVLDSERFREFLAEARTVYDRVVIDTAPVLPVSDTASLVAQADVVVFCCRIDEIRRDTFEAGRDHLEHLGVSRYAVAASGITRRRSSSTPYGGYGYYAPDVGRGSPAGRRSFLRRGRRRRR